MAAAKAIVASDIEAFRALIDEGTSGLMVPPVDEKNIADAIMRFIEDPALRARCGHAARHANTSPNSIWSTMNAYWKKETLRAGAACALFTVALGLLIARIVTTQAIETRIVAGILILVWIVMGIYALWLFIPQLDPWLIKVRRAHRGKKIVALTFDDGPAAPWTAHVLDILKAHNVPATFFVVGAHAKKFPELVLRASHEGHVVGAHTNTHRIMTFLSPGERLAEIEASMDAVAAIIGCRPNLFRLPHGFKFPGMYGVMAEWNLVPIPWTKGLWDTDMPTDAQLLARFKRRFSPFEILLLHDGIGDGDPRAHRHAMIAALPLMIEEYKRRGYEFVTIADLCDHCTCVDNK